MKKIISYALFTCLSFSHEIVALTEPKASSYDARVRHVTYNPQDVVSVDVVIGTATHIVLEEGEQYVTHAFGDSKAWAFANERNHYFIKPKDKNADTNLTIVTDRRTYYFKLRYYDNTNQLPMYGINFRYPDSEKRRIREITKKAELEKNFKGQRGIYNISYTMSGDTDIAPINTWDNGEFTYFKFPPSIDIPGIYMVSSDGTESIVNRTTTGKANNVIAVQKVNPKWVLRLGNRALAVYNDHYDAIGISNTSRTISPTVKRILKEGAS